MALWKISENRGGNPPMVDVADYPKLARRDIHLVVKHHLENQILLRSVLYAGTAQGKRNYD